MQKQQAHRIVIVGGGAGGLELATKLGRRLGRRDEAHITLVDTSLLHVWKPLFHEVAAGTLDSQEDAINYLAHAARNHFHFQLGRMCGVDRSSKALLLETVVDEHGHELAPARQLPYDTLVISIGSITNDFGTPGASSHCYQLDNIGDAERFQHRLIQAFLRRQAYGNPTPARTFEIAIVGGGATGVELAAELRWAARQAIHYGLDDFDPERDLKLTVIEAAERLLPPLSPALSVRAQKQLEEMGVTVITSERVTEVRPDGLQTSTGRFIPAQMMVWSAGIKAPDVLRNLNGLETNRQNQLVVRPTLQTTHDDCIFAFGDCASAPQPGSERPVPPRAQAASQQASFLARNLPRHLRGKPLQEFTYRDRGSLISLSADDAVGRLMGSVVRGVMIEGLLARLAYSSLAKKHLAAVHGPFRVALKSFADLLTKSGRPRLKLH